MAFTLTVKLALTTTVLLLLFGTPLAWWLSRSKGLLKTVVESVVALPLVLPPTVLGFYLLILFGPQGWVGQWMSALELPLLVFSFWGLVLGSMIYSLPFVVQPLQSAFEGLSPLYLEVASTLGASRWDRMINLILPLTKRGFLSAITLGFAHTVGEFGVVLMVGGNIPGKTQVLSIAIYDHVESMQYAKAHLLAGGLLIFSAVTLFLFYFKQRVRL